MGFEYDVAIVGGCGRVGLPLGITFASRGLKVALQDLNGPAVDQINAAQMPFREDGADEALKRLTGESLVATTDPAVVARAEHVVIVIGTPVDEHLNPVPAVVLRLIADLAPHLVDGQHIVLRSTVYPGTTTLIERAVSNLGLDVDVSFCPERIAEGRAMRELTELPQLVSASTDAAFDRAEKLFRSLSDSVIRMQPDEAELAKLISNAWRYIKFATANQFFVMADSRGLDYERIRSALAEGYSRAADLPRAGFAAGPCLMKDTMQLAAFADNNFPIGHSAMLVNEGLPLYLVRRLEERHDLGAMTVGLLGMAFKADSDDARSSLSYKLKRVLGFSARRVLCHDPFVTTDADLYPLEDVLAAADLIVIGAPHRMYGSVRFEGPVLDIWGLLDTDL